MTIGKKSEKFFGFPLTLSDDGVSGTRFDRPGFMAMMEEVEDGNVEAIIVKDMSRRPRPPGGAGRPCWP